MINIHSLTKIKFEYFCLKPPKGNTNDVRWLLEMCEITQFSGKVMVCACAGDWVIIL